VISIEPKAKEICAVANPLLYTAESYSLEKFAYFSKIYYDTLFQELLVSGANVPPASQVDASITQLLLGTEN
jgi:hypothetical protein